MVPGKEPVLWVCFGHPVGIWERRLSALGNVDDSPFDLIYHDCMMYVYRCWFSFFIFHFFFFSSFYYLRRTDVGHKRRAV